MYLSVQHFMRLLKKGSLVGALVLFAVTNLGRTAKRSICANDSGLIRFVRACHSEKLEGVPFRNLACFKQMLQAG